MKMQDGDFDVIEEARKDALREEKSAGDLRTVGSLVSRLQALERRKMDLEEEMKRLDASIAQLRDKELPDAMLQMGVTRWETKMPDGSSQVVGLERTFYPGVKTEDMPRLVEWLRDRGDDGIVKPKVVVDFAKGEYDRAAETISELRETHPELEIRLAPEIHWATFRSFTKELVTSGEQLPPFYTYHEINRATIKTVKRG